ncbi:hypothetical protein DFP72DRAFT_1058297 [Ephemerocybe angulata]|uniref:Uncharacterized protein n=1 Tax=Ephemerocybe angulata TaxID=980116 RepID=A0A8H6IIX8_9AGAR|nr:hypothetical protein DFP72DRAFT_1058297 [Tulosesus angulatus]
MRLSLSTLTALTVAVLTSFSNANLHNELEARDIEYFLEQREILDGLSTRELIDELSGRLDRRAGKKASPKPGGLQYTKTCTKCKKTFTDYGEYDNHICIIDVTPPPSPRGGMLRRR